MLILLDLNIAKLFDDVHHIIFHITACKRMINIRVK